MKSICIWTLTFSFVLVIGCSSGESYVKTGYNFSKLDKVAVVSVEGRQLRGQAAKNQIADFGKRDAGPPLPMKFPLC